MAGCVDQLLDEHRAGFKPGADSLAPTKGALESRYIAMSEHGCGNPRSAPLVGRYSQPGV